MEHLFLMFLDHTQRRNTVGRTHLDELITRPEEFYRLWCVVVCDLETSKIGAPYIYDISSLRVNDLTLILLTWRKWCAPNNASKQQMGFNSAFKGLTNRLVLNDISDFRRKVDGIYVLLGYCAAYGGNSLPTFRDNLSVPSLRARNLKMGPIGCPETSGRNYHYTLHNTPQETRFDDFNQIQHVAYLD